MHQEGMEVPCRERRVAAGIASTQSLETVVNELKDERQVEVPGFGRGGRGCRQLSGRA
jgi:hypothetical protein